MWQTHFAGNATGHGSTVRNNLIAMAFAAEVVRQVHQKTARTASEVSDDALPAHKVINCRSKKVEKNDSVGRGWLPVEGVEAANANSTRDL